MSHSRRSNWSEEISQVIRSRHYTWLGKGLGGESVVEAMTDLTTDIMHICKREGVSWEQLLERSRRKFEEEESQLLQECAHYEEECAQNEVLL